MLFGPSSGNFAKTASEFNHFTIVKWCRISGFDFVWRALKLLISVPSKCLMVFTPWRSDRFIYTFNEADGYKFYKIKQVLQDESMVCIQISVRPYINTDVIHEGLNFGNVGVFHVGALVGEDVVVSLQQFQITF